jgi:hypothetical protein
MAQSRTLVLAAAAALLLSGCPQNGNSGSKSPEVFSEHKFLTNCGATKQFGESCYGCGDQECAYSGAVCLHVKPEPDDPTGWLCSKQCASDADCPVAGWSCRAISPASEEGENFMHCVPPQNP